VPSGPVKKASEHRKGGEAIDEVKEIFEDRQLDRNRREVQPRSWRFAQGRLSPEQVDH